jgi:hypothetical protein
MGKGCLENKVFGDRGANDVRKPRVFPRWNGRGIRGLVGRFFGLHYLCGCRFHLSVDPNTTYMDSLTDLLIDCLYCIESSDQRLHC